MTGEEEVVVMLNSSQLTLYCAFIDIFQDKNDN